MTNQNKDRMIKVQSIQEAVVENIRQRILNGELKPGQRLVQDELTAELGVSRTPIREALNQLVHEGLVTISDHRRTFVAEFSTEDLVETYTMRAALESHAAYLAARRITEPELRKLEAILTAMASAYQHNQLEKLISTHHDFHAGINDAAHISVPTLVISNAADTALSVATATNNALSIVFREKPAAAPFYGLWWAGDHVAAWDGLDEQGHALASGVYLVSAKSGDGLEYEPPKTPNVVL